MASISAGASNQAYQFNSVSLSTQSFDRGHFCNGAVLNIAPYFLESEMFTSSYSKNRNYGGQLSFSFPLDGGAVETCKALARKRLQKATLDYELVRIKECMGILDRGYTIHPESPFSVICRDVVPIAALEPSSTEPASSSTSRASSAKP